MAIQLGRTKLYNKVGVRLEDKSSIIVLNKQKSDATWININSHVKDHFLLIFFSNFYDIKKIVCNELK